MEVVIMKIGITERGDIAFDSQWVDRFDEMDFSILISKGLPSSNLQFFMIENSDKIIFHATTTGYGGTILEPNIVDFKTRIDKLRLFCESFPLSHVVIRVDPIICTSKGIAVAEKVIAYAINSGFNRFRYSFIDMYPHVKDRFIKAGLPIPTVDINSTLAMINVFEKKYPGLISFESCAENTKHQVGCISSRDLDILGLKGELNGSANQRKGCLCPFGKTELLNRKHPCPHNCLYCYWKD